MSGYSEDLITAAKIRKAKELIIEAARASSGADDAWNQEQYNAAVRRAQLTDDTQVAQLNRRYLEKLRHEALLDTAGKRRSWTREQVRQGIAIQDEGKTWDAETEAIFFNTKTNLYEVAPRPKILERFNRTVSDLPYVQEIKVTNDEPTALDPFWIQKGGKRIKKTMNGDPIPEGLESWYNGDLSIWRRDPKRARKIEPLILEGYQEEQDLIAAGYALAAACSDNTLKNHSLASVSSSAVESVKAVNETFYKALVSKYSRIFVGASYAGGSAVAIATGHLDLVPVLALGGFGYEYLARTTK